MIYEVEYEYNEGTVPDERSVNLCQLHAEMDLWATRYKLSKVAYDFAHELADEIEKWDYSESRLSEVREKAQRWERAVEKNKEKYEQAKAAYENYLAELQKH